MAPSAKESGSSARRKSFNPLSRATPNHLPHINTDVGSINSEKGDNDKKKLGRRSSIFGLGSVQSPGGQEGGLSPVTGGALDSPKARPRTLQKGRPSSIFGSLGRKSVNHIEEKEEGEGAASPISLAGSGDGMPGSSHSPHVLYHGEIQTASGMFRKKKEYLVLTETHLVRFKSQARAAETFSSVASHFGRNHNSRHPSSTSIGSLHEVQSMASHHSGENENRIPLQQVVTIYKVEDGRPYFTLEVVYLDEEVNGAGSVQLILQDPKEADLWHTSIRGAATKARLLMTEPYPERVIRYLVAAVEAANDYSPLCFHVFRVVRRLSAFKALRASQDDLQKVGNAVYYLVIGMNLIHLIPLPDFQRSSKELELDRKKSRICFGILSLIKVWVNYEDDRFELEYRIPMKSAEILELASSGNPDIGYAALQIHHYLKPQWLDTTYNYRGPRPICDIPDIKINNDTDFGCFDRTLCAYMIAYGCNPSNVQYTVDESCEIKPEFRLCKPRYKKYSALELLSVFRALRYNQLFRSISFQGINLHDLHGIYDRQGYEHLATSSRDGIDVKFMSVDPSTKSLLYREIQALILKSYTLRRLDFSDCLPRREPTDFYETEDEPNADRDPGCEIISALMPMGDDPEFPKFPILTWLALNGITLGETDIECMRATLHKPSSKIKAIEMSRCRLNDRLIMQVITNMERQYATMECIDISQNPGRIDLNSFQRSMTHYTKLRRINLSKTFWTTSKEPIFAPKVMMTWKLEELHLDGVSINGKTIDAISTYLASEASDNLRVIHLNQCNLTGTDVAVLMHAMCRRVGEIRDLDLHVDSNRVEKGIAAIIKAVKMQHAPTGFYMRMVEFEKEDHFRELLTVLRSNKTIRRLDIAKASLPQDADDDTCEELRLMFKENETLQYLDISGEQSHLETTRFGVGLTYALTGLLENTTLRSLRIEYQNLGVQGADTLASVIEKNTGLRQIYCDNNEITLQGYTSIVNALTKNYTLLELPVIKSDGYQALKQLRRNTLGDSENHAWNVDSKDAKPQTIRQKLQGIGIGSKKGKPETTEQDFAAAAQYLSERWDAQMQRVEKLLERNANIEANVPGYRSSAEADSTLDEEYLRPTTALSDRTILEQVKSHTTPRFERKDPYEAATSSLGRPISRPNSGGNNVKFAEEVTVRQLSGENLPMGGNVQRANNQNPETNVGNGQADYGWQNMPRHELDNGTTSGVANGWSHEDVEEYLPGDDTAVELSGQGMNRRARASTAMLARREHLRQEMKRGSDDSAATLVGNSFDDNMDANLPELDGTEVAHPRSSNGIEPSAMPELRLPSDDDKYFELSESERAIFAALES